MSPTALNRSVSNGALEGLSEGNVSSSVKRPFLCIRTWTSKPALPVVTTSALPSPSKSRHSTVKALTPRSVVGGNGVPFGASACTLSSAPL